MINALALSNFIVKLCLSDAFGRYITLKVQAIETNIIKDKKNATEKNSSNSEIFLCSQ